MFSIAEISSLNSVCDFDVKAKTIKSFKLDSKQVEKEDAFIAIKGQKHNSLKFKDSALKNGASVIIYEDSLENQELIDKQFCFIKVSSSSEFLSDLSQLISQKIKNKQGFVIGISGSNGKTTTRLMLEHLIKETDLPYIATQANNNNHIGVPLTLMQVEQDTQIAIVELGSNHPGEIKYLVEASAPNIGVTTNIGETHREFFPTLESVLEEEGYLLKYLFENNHSGFINADDALLKSSSGISFGESGADFQFKVGESQVEVIHNSYSYLLKNSNITGKHNFINLAVAFSIALKVAPKHREIFLTAASSFTPSPNRSEWLRRDGVSIFLDAYNANPSSMRASLEGFFEKADSSSLCILGDMGELGEHAKKLHYETLSGVSWSANFVFIGEHADDWNHSAVNGEVKTFKSTEDFRKNFDSKTKSYKYIFIKGSRALQLDSLKDIRFS